MITLDQFTKMVGCSRDRAVVWHPLFIESMDRWFINTPLRQAGFLAQITWESGRLNNLQESLNYSVQGLVNTWPKRFGKEIEAGDGKKVLVPNERAKALGRSPEHPANQQGIANYVYANRMGNAPEETGDGWRFRGRGPKQITGHDNYKACGQALGLDLLGHPDLLLEPRYGALAAGWYWDMSGCSPLMDKKDFRAVTIAINGGLLGYNERKMLLEKNLGVLTIPW